MPSRGKFLAGVAAIAAVDSLWSCSRATTSAPGAMGMGTPVPSPDLDRFLALSAILTGSGALDAGVGAAYLRNVRANAEQSAALDALYGQSGMASSNPPQTLADLAKTGVFAQSATLAMTSQMLANWFSGTYATANGTVTATWNDALAWKACTFTKPPGMCGGATGYWAKPPAA